MCQHNEKLTSLKQKTVYKLAEKRKGQYYSAYMLHLIDTKKPETAINVDSDPYGLALPDYKGFHGVTLKEAKLMMGMEVDYGLTAISGYKTVIIKVQLSGNIYDGFEGLSSRRSFRGDKQKFIGEINED